VLSVISAGRHELSVISVRRYKVIIHMGYIYSYVRREEEFE